MRRSKGGLLLLALMFPFLLVASTGGIAATPADKQVPDVLLPAPGDAASQLMGQHITHPGELTLEMIDVGQGDGNVVHLPGGGVLVVDMGPSSATAWYNLRRHLEADGVKTITALIATHPHADHVGNCANLFRSYEVKMFFHPGFPYSTNDWNACLAEAAKEPGLKVFTDANLDPGDYINFDPAVTTRLLDVWAKAPQANEASIVLRFTYGSISFVLTGDAYCSNEDYMIRKGFALGAQLLKIGHHGSKSSTCDAWLQHVDPIHAFVSAGEGNPYGHPHNEVVSRLAAHNVRMHLTAKHGWIVGTTDGKSLYVHREHWITNLPGDEKVPEQFDGLGEIERPAPVVREQR